METVTIKRTFNALTFKHTYDDNLPILYPTNNTCKADIWLKVSTNGVPQARIPLHKDHICENIPFFSKMFGNTRFRESSMQEIPFESGYSAQFICDYLATTYNQQLDPSTIKRIDFCCLADYLEDYDAIEACKKVLKEPEYMSQSRALALMGRSRTYDDICVDFVKYNGLHDIDEYSDAIGELGYEAFVQLVNYEVTESLSRSSELRLIQTWLKKNPSSKHFEQFILKMDFSHFEVSSKLDFYGELMTGMSQEMSQMVYKHMFDKSPSFQDRAPTGRRARSRSMSPQSAPIKYDAIEEESSYIEPDVDSDIEQVVEVVTAADKPEHLESFLQESWADQVVQTVIFTTTRRGCDDISDQLVRSGWEAASIHGGKDEHTRRHLLKNFGVDVHILVTTGLGCLKSLRFDLSDVELVINYDFPRTMGDYKEHALLANTAFSRITLSGKVYTMMTRNDGRFRDELLALLKQSGQEVPQDLLRMPRSLKRRLYDQ